MTIAVGILLGIAGLAAVAIGLALFVMFRIGLRVFDRSLRSEVAGQGREQVERAALLIPNPLVRRFVMRHLVETGGTVAVALVRGGIESRMRTGLYIGIAGAIAFIAAFFTGSWLPLIWKTA
jgi:hypothetical protein